ncbi:transposase [Streptomyces sp. NPDC017259]|uniref:transposase n=1 Tax=Streptomyces sp. NPDC017259 TaxID=3364991 RepID=UPI0037A55BC6
MGLEHLLTLSTGEKIANPRRERADRARLAKAQRSLARKAKGDGADRAKARRGAGRVCLWSWCKTSTDSRSTTRSR